MQTPFRQKYDRRGRIAGIAMNLSRAAFIATLLTWTTFSIGGDNQNPKSEKSSAGPTRAGAVKDPAPGSGHGRIGPTCAQLGEIGSSSRQIEKSLIMGDMVGCGIGSNLA